MKDLTGWPHNNHPLRHFDRTCSACRIEQLERKLANLDWWCEPCKERFSGPPDDGVSRAACPTCGYWMLHYQEHRAEELERDQRRVALAVQEKAIHVVRINYGDSLNGSKIIAMLRALDLAEIVKRAAPAAPTNAAPEQEAAMWRESMTTATRSEGKRAAPAAPDKMRDLIRMALDELGVPQPGYPAPVVNAVEFLNEALRAAPTAPKGQT